MEPETLEQAPEETLAPDIPVDEPLDATAQVPGAAEVPHRDHADPYAQALEEARQVGRSEFDPWVAYRAAQIERNQNELAGVLADPAGIRATLAGDAAAMGLQHDSDGATVLAAEYLQAMAREARDAAIVRQPGARKAALLMALGAETLKRSREGSPALVTSVTPIGVAPRPAFSPEDQRFLVDYEQRFNNGKRLTTRQIDQLRQEGIIG